MLGPARSIARCPNLLFQLLQAALQLILYRALEKLLQLGFTQTGGKLTRLKGLLQGLSHLPLGLLRQLLQHRWIELGEIEHLLDPHIQHLATQPPLQLRCDPIALIPIATAPG